MKLSPAQLKEIRDACQVALNSSGWRRADDKELFVNAVTEMVKGGVATKQAIGLLVTLYSTGLDFHDGA
jgi:hypothetical protein